MIFTVVVPKIVPNKEKRLYQKALKPSNIVILQINWCR